MKIVASPIEMIAWVGTAGEMRPLRFKYLKKDNHQVITVDRITKVEKICKAGQDAVVYTCESQIDNILRHYELRYVVGEGVWSLYKI